MPYLVDCLGHRRGKLHSLRTGVCVRVVLLFFSFIRLETADRAEAFAMFFPFFFSCFSLSLSFLGIVPADPQDGTNQSIGVRGSGFGVRIN